MFMRMLVLLCRLKYPVLSIPGIHIFADPLLSFLAA